MLLGRIRAAEPPPLAGAHRWQVRHDLRDGLRAVLRHDLVRPVVRALVVWSVAGGFFTALYTLFCLRTLGLSASTYGVIVAVGGVGSLCGALLSRRLVARLGLGPSLIACATISLVGLLLIPLASGPRWLVLTLLAAHQLISDGFSVAFVIQAVTLRQTALPKDVLGRANAAVHVATGGLVPVAALAAGALAELTSIRTAVWVGVLIGLVAPLCLLPLRHVRALPSATSPTDQTQASAG